MNVWVRRDGRPVVADEFDDALSLVLSAGADPDRVVDAWWEAEDPECSVHFSNQRVELRSFAVDVAAESASRFEPYIVVRGRLGEPPVTERIERTMRLVDDPRLTTILAGGLLVE